MKDPDPIGTILKTDLRDKLQMLVFARPDLQEAVALIAIGTGLGEYVRLPDAPAQIIAGKQIKRLNGGHDEN